MTTLFTGVKRVCLKLLGTLVIRYFHSAEIYHLIDILNYISRYDHDILPYIESQWVMFQPPESLSSLTPWQREDRILDVLIKHKDRFGMLRQKRLENYVWWLKIVAPPPGPRFRVTSDKILTEKTILKEIYVGRYKTDPSKLEAAIPNYLLNTTMPKMAPEKAVIDQHKKEKEYNISNNILISSTESCVTNTATMPADLKRQTRSAATSNNNIILCSDLVPHSKGESKVVLNVKPKKIKFPRVAMKFCSNQRIKPNRNIKGEESIVSVPILEEACLVPIADDLLLMNDSSDRAILDRFIPAPDTFSGINNPFRLCDDKIREARKLICTRRLGVEDLTKVSFWFEPFCSHSWR